MEHRELRPLLTEVFGEDAAKRFMDGEREQPTDNDDFLFACMHATEYIHTISLPGQYQNYVDLIRGAFATAKLETEEELGMEDFFAELVQNSLDHNHGEATRPIEIEVQELEGGGFSYAHNGVRFGFEPKKEDSTLTGVFKGFSNLKRYDFRIGRFGIGFKLWTRFFQKMNLQAIYEGKSFTVQFDISEGQIDRRCFYNETDEPDITKFDFLKPRSTQDDVWKEIENRMIEVMSSYPEMMILAQFGRHNGVENRFESTITPRRCNEGNHIEEAVDVSIVKNHSPIKQLTVLTGDLFNLADQEVTIYRNIGSLRRTEFASMREFVSDEYNFDSVSVDVEEFFQRRFFKYVFDSQSPRVDVAFLKQMQPIQGGPKSSTGLQFECNHFQLERDRQNLKRGIMKYKEVNNLLLIEMFDSLFRSLLHLVKKDPGFESFLFRDGLPYLKHQNATELDFIERVEDKFNNDYKDLYRGLLKNKSSQEIQSPRRLFGDEIEHEVARNLNIWFEEKISDSVWSTKLKDVPFHQTAQPKVILPGDSIVMHDLEPYPAEDLAEVLIENDLYESFLQEFSDAEFVKHQFPLGQDTWGVILLNENVHNTELGKLCLSTEQHTKGKLKIYSPVNIEEYGRYQAAADYRGDIWIPGSEDELRENLGTKVFNFLGGRPVSSEEISYLERILKEHPLIQKGNISVWDEEEYVPLQDNVLVNIPKFEWSVPANNFRTIEYGPDLEMPRGWVGFPASGQGESKRAWWCVASESNASYPSPSSEFQNIIFSDGLDEGLVEKHSLHERCMLLLGSPFNASEIMESFGIHVLKKGSGFIKFDIPASTLETRQMIMKLHEHALPLSINFKTLNEYGMGEYDVRSAQLETMVTLQNERTRKANVGEMKLDQKSVPSDFSRKNFYDSAGMAPLNSWRKDFFRAAIDHMNSSSRRSSAIVVNYLPWERVFHHTSCVSGQIQIAYYSMLVSPLNQTPNVGRLDQFAIRFGKHVGGRLPKYGGSFAMAHIPGDNKRGSNLDSGAPNRPPSGDGVWTVKDKIKQSHPVREEAFLLSSTKLDVENWFNTRMLGCFPIQSAKTVSQGIQQFLNSGQDSVALEAWYETTREYLPDNIEVSLPDQTLRGLLEAVSDDSLKEFLGNLTAQSADEIRREFEEELRANPDNAERLFLSAENEFFKGYYLYKKGDKQIKNNSETDNKSNRPIISQQFINLFLNPLEEDGEMKYQKWDSAVHYRAITGEAVNKLLKVHAEMTGEEQLKYLIKSDMSLSIANLEYINEDHFTEVEEIDEQWSSSFDIFSEIIGYTDVRLVKVPRETQSLIFDKQLAVGKNGWDIRFSPDTKTIHFLISDVVSGQPIERMDALKRSMKRVARGCFGWLESFRFEDEFREVGAGTTHIFEDGWQQAHARPDFESYLQRTEPDDLVDLYREFTTGLEEIVRTKGKPALGSNAANIMALTIGAGQNENEEFVADQTFEAWYSMVPSCAADEPIVHFANETIIPTSNTRLFRYNSEKVYETDDAENGKRIDWLAKVGLDRFFGGIIKLGAVFSRQARYKEHGVRAKLAAPCPFEAAIRSIASGELNVSENKLVIVKDALLIAGQSGNLKVHVLHLAGMAALAEIHRNHASADDN